MADAETLARLAAAMDKVVARTPPRDVQDGPSSGAQGADDDRALAFLLRSTAQRPLSMAEARAKLATKLGPDTPEEALDAVVERAVRLGALDDGAFARMWVTDRGLKRGYGRDRLTRELRNRKVDQAAIDAALELLEDHDHEAQALALARSRAQRMPATLEPMKVAQRLVGFLVRRGYDTNLAHRVARQATALDRDWD